jgi:diaminohydroxyphosphoribosylaminopyrimidine deaminase / 5-amino-6-(5-phosphoribosylamino)uracil reductase
VSAACPTGAAGRKPLAITGEEVRARVHLLRAQSDAIMIGIGTALADNPLLTCRLSGLAARSPVRVVLDSALRLPHGSQLVRSARDVPLWVFAGTQASPTAERELVSHGAEVLRVGERDGRLDLTAVLKHLATRGITRLMVEGGPTLAAALVAADLVDEAVLFKSQRIVGPNGVDALEGLPLTALTQSERLGCVESEAVGADQRDLYERK